MSSLQLQFESFSLSRLACRSFSSVSHPEMAALSLLLLLSASFACAAGSASQAAEKDGGGVVAGGALWCVAKNNAEDAALQTALDWACGQGGADCGPVQPGGGCFEPEDVQSHASFAFNDYYRRHGSEADACDFAGSAALTSLDPSHDSCRFPSSTSTGNGNFSGSTAGGSVGEDMSGCAILPPEAWTGVLTLALAIVVAAVSS